MGLSIRQIQKINLFVFFKMKTKEQIKRDGLSLKKCYSNLNKIRTIKNKLRLVFGFNHAKYLEIIKEIKKGEDYTLKCIEVLK